MGKWREQLSCYYVEDYRSGTSFFIRGISYDYAPPWKWLRMPTGHRASPSSLTPYTHAPCTNGCEHPHKPSTRSLYPRTLYKRLWRPTQTVHSLPIPTHLVQTAVKTHTNRPLAPYTHAPCTNGCEHPHKPSTRSLYPRTLYKRLWTPTQTVHSLPIPTHLVQTAVNTHTNRPLAPYTHAPCTNGCEHPHKPSTRSLYPRTLYKRLWTPTQTVHSLPIPTHLVQTAVNTHTNRPLAPYTHAPCTNGCEQPHKPSTRSLYPRTLYKRLWTPTQTVHSLPIPTHLVQTAVNAHTNRPLAPYTHAPCTNGCERPHKPSTRSLYPRTLYKRLWTPTQTVHSLPIPTHLVQTAVNNHTHRPLNLARHDVTRHTPSLPPSLPHPLSCLPPCLFLAPSLFLFSSSLSSLPPSFFLPCLDPSLPPSLPPVTLPPSLPLSLSPSFPTSRHPPSFPATLT